VTIIAFYCTYHVFKKILKTRSVWLSIGSENKYLLEIFEKRRKQGLPISQDMHHLNFLMDSAFIHASDVSRMRSGISILKILKLSCQVQSEIILQTIYNFRNRCKCHDCFIKTFRAFFSERF